MEKLTKQQRSNAEILRDVINAKIAKNENPDILDFHFQPCGTYGCVAGDTYISMGLMPKGAEMSSCGLFLDDDLDDNFLDWVNDFENIFGFEECFKDCGDFCSVFVDSYSGTLKQRLTYVKSQLSEH